MHKRQIKQILMATKITCSHENQRRAVTVSPSRSIQPHSGRSQPAGFYHSYYLIPILVDGILAGTASSETFLRTGHFCGHFPLRDLSAASAASSWRIFTRVLTRLPRVSHETGEITRDFTTLYDITRRLTTLGDTWRHCATPDSLRRQLVTLPDSWAIFHDAARQLTTLCEAQRHFTTIEVN